MIELGADVSHLKNFTSDETLGGLAVLGGLSTLPAAALLELRAASVAAVRTR